MRVSGAIPRRQFEIEVIDRVGSRISIPVLEHCCRLVISADCMGMRCDFRWPRSHGRRLWYSHHRKVGSVAE